MLKAAVYRLTAKLAKSARTPDSWHISFLIDVHRELFSSVFPEQAGILRQKDVTFRSHVIPSPGQVMYRLQDVVARAREIVEEARGIPELEQRIEAVLPRIAALHADCVVIQPFIDVNKRWARQVLSALLADVGLTPGTLIKESDKASYLEAIDKSVAGEPDQLANLILEGWYELDEMFRNGRY